MFAVTKPVPGLGDLSKHNPVLVLSPGQGKEAGLQQGACFGFSSLVEGRYRQSPLVWGTAGGFLGGSGICKTSC